MVALESLMKGRAAFDQDDWATAFALLSEADRVAPLDPADLDRLATAAFLVGDDAISLAVRVALRRASGRCERRAGFGRIEPARDRLFLMLGTAAEHGIEAQAQEGSDHG